MTEDEMRQILREMQDITVPPDSLARVRLNLEGRIRRRYGWRTAGFLAALSAALVALVLFGPITPQRVPVRNPPVQRHSKIAVVDAPRAGNEPVENAEPELVPAVRVRHKAHRKAPAAAPVTIRIQTPDPDVVILLVGD